MGCGPGEAIRRIPTSKEWAILQAEYRLQHEEYEASRRRATRESADDEEPGSDPSRPS